MESNLFNTSEQVVTRTSATTTKTTTEITTTSKYKIVQYDIIDDRKIYLKKA